MTKQRPRIAFSLGLFLFVLYLFSYRGGFHSVDEVSTFAVTESLVKFGRFNTDQIAWTQWVTTQAEAQGFFGLDGHVYSKKGLAISLAQAPLYWLALHLPGIGMVQTVSLLNAILTAWTAGLIYAILRRLTFSVPGALLTALLYGTGTLAWIYAKYLFSGTLAGFLLLMTMYLLLLYRFQQRLWRLALAGFCGGLTVLARANNLLLLFGFGVYLLAILVDLAGKSGQVDKKEPSKVGWPFFYMLLKGPNRAAVVMVIIIPIAIFMAGAALAGGLFAWYNWLRAGNPLQTGYDLTLFSPNIFLGVYKLLFSPLRGLFIYSPLLILALPGWFHFRKRDAYTYTYEAWLILGLVSITLLLFSAWSSGEGLSWGSRFLAPIVPFFVLALAPLIEDFFHHSLWLRWSIILISLVSITIQVMGVAINPWVYLNDLQTHFGGEFFLERTAALVDFSTTQIVGQLRNWQVVHSDVIWWQPTGFDGLSFGLGLILVLAAGWTLKQAVRSNAPFLGRIALPIMLPLTAGCTFFLLTRYYQLDQQFGSPDQPYIQALNQVAAVYNAGDKVLTVAQYDYHVPMNRFKAKIPLTGFAQNENPLPATAYPLLADDNRAERVWLITVGRRPAEPTNRVEAWLAQNKFKADDIWLSDVRLITYGLPHADHADEVYGVNETLGQTMHLVEIRRPKTIQGGQILPITFQWERIAPSLPVLTDYVIFIQLIAIDGRLAAQHDGPPQGGYLPTSQWPAGKQLLDRHGVSIPADLDPGDYRLITGMYNPADGLRLLTVAGSDFIDLGIVTVTQ